MNLQTGAFGDPKSTETLVLFWGKMELLHYPGASATKKYLEDRLRREQAQADAAAQLQQLIGLLKQNGIQLNQGAMGGQVAAAPTMAPAM